LSFKFCLVCTQSLKLKIQAFMKREYRLRRGWEIDRVRKTGRSWSAGPVVLYAAPGPDPQMAARSGFITGKKIGGAVERNQAKRRMREAVRVLIPQITPGWDLLWIARPSMRTSDFGRISAAVQECLRRARLLNSSPPDGGLVGQDNDEMARPQVDPVVSGDA
jgi:ribonuclease P protein component